MGTHASPAAAAPMTLGQCLRQARQRRGLSLATAAPQVQTRRETPLRAESLRNIERDLTPPSPLVLRQLVRLYQLDLAELIAYPDALIALLPQLCAEQPESTASLQQFLAVWLRAFCAGPQAAAADTAPDDRP